MEDSEIVQLLKDSPDDGLNALLKEYGGLLKAIVLRILGAAGKDEGEEVLSDILLRFWQSVEVIDPEREGGIKAYLCKIARNTAINRKRKRDKLADITLEWELASDFDMDEAVIHNMNESVVTAAVNSLPEPDRTIFIRRYYCCQRVKTIAEEMGLSPKRVENVLSRKKSRLKSFLNERGVIL